MGRRGHPPEFRRKVLDLLEEEGRSVASVAHDLGISAESIYTWRPQDRVDRGLVPGLTRSVRQSVGQRVGRSTTGAPPAGRSATPRAATRRSAASATSTTNLAHQEKPAEPPKQDRSMMSTT